MSEERSSLAILVERFIEIDERHKAIRQQEKDISAERRQVMEAVVDAFVGEGLASWRTSDGKTVHLQQTIRAAWPQGREAAVKVLEREGLSDLLSVDFNANRLSAWMREQVADGATEPELPVSFDGTIVPITITDARVRRS